MTWASALMTCTLDTTTRKRQEPRNRHMVGVPLEPFPWEHPASQLSTNTGKGNRRHCLISTLSLCCTKRLYEKNLLWNRHVHKDGRTIICLSFTKKDKPFTSISTTEAMQWIKCFIHARDMEYAARDCKWTCLTHAVWEVLHMHFVQTDYRAVLIAYVCSPEQLHTSAVVTAELITRLTCDAIATHLTFILCHRFSQGQQYACIALHLDYSGSDALSSRTHILHIVSDV